MERRRLLKINEVAEILRFKAQTIRNQRCRKIFPIAPIKIGGRLLWDERDVLKYLEGLRPADSKRGRKSGKEVGKERLAALRVPH
jgi:predicted DNA-binding transcriptional regulator AlpA